MKDAYAEQPAPEQCYTPGCAHDARVRRRVGVNAAGGSQWRNLCWSCDDKWHHERHARWCVEKGLETVEAQKAFCRAALKRGIVKREVTVREPGDDDE